MNTGDVCASLTVYLATIYTDDCGQGARDAGPLEGRQVDTVLKRRGDECRHAQKSGVHASDDRRAQACLLKNLGSDLRRWWEEQLAERSLVSANHMHVYPSAIAPSTADLSGHQH